MIDSPEHSRLGMPPEPPVVEVRDLKVDFWVDGDWYPAVRGASFDLDRGGGDGDRRRVGLGEVDDRPGDDGPAAAERLRARVDPPRRRSGDRRARRAHAALDARPRRVDDLPGADDGAQPRLHDRLPDRRDAAQPPVDVSEAGAQAGDRAARPRRDPEPGTARRLVPARAVGWPAPAGHDRPGTGRWIRRCWSPTNRRPPSTSPCRRRSSSSSATCATASTRASC